MALHHVSEHAAAQAGHGVKRSSTNLLVIGLLHLMAAMFMFRPFPEKIFEE